MFGRKTFFILGASAGYVLGAKAGTERYEQIAGLTQKVNSDPRVKKACETVSNLSGDVLGDAVGKISGKLPEWAPGHRHADSMSSANGHGH